MKKILLCLSTLFVFSITFDTLQAQSPEKERMKKEKELRKKRG